MTVEKKDQNSPIKYCNHQDHRSYSPVLLHHITYYVLYKPLSPSWFASYFGNHNSKFCKKIRTFPKFSENFHGQIMFSTKNIEFAHHEKYKRLQREKYESLSLKISPSIWPDYYNGTRKKDNYIQPPRCHLETKSLMTWLLANCPVDLFLFRTGKSKSRGQKNLPRSQFFLSKSLHWSYVTTITTTSLYVPQASSPQQ